MSSVKRRILITSAVSFVLIACFTAGYFTVLEYLKWKNRDEQTSEVAGKVTVNANSTVEDLINSETSINIIHSYMVDGKEVYLENSQSKADKNIVGMNKAQFEHYYGDKGYTVVEYSSTDAGLRKVINGWPAGKYVVRQKDNKVAIYSVNDKNQLVMEEETEISMDLVPDGDREEIIKGKVYDNLDAAREYVEYSLGS